MNITGERAYFYCIHCGCELVGEVAYSRSTADGEHGICPICGGESSVDYDNKDESGDYI